MARKTRLGLASLVLFVAAAVGLLGWVILPAADEAAKAPAGAPATVAKESSPPSKEPSAPPKQPSPPSKEDGGDYPVPAPPFSEGIFPCTDCHNADLPANPNRRNLRNAHREIQLRHDEEHRWCLDCHLAEKRNFLRSASGAPIEFAESYRLCGQCHGDKYRDWRAGVHGKRTGQWNGQKNYLLCVHCHDPHSPKFKPIQPLPPPVRPAAQ